LLDRNGKINFIGQDIADGLKNITGISVLDVTKNLAIMTNTRCYIFNLLYGQFSTFEPVVAVASCLLNETWHWSDSAGKIYKLGTTGFDGATRVSFELQTGWIKLTSLMGLQRVRKLQVLGANESATTLNLEIETNYDTSYSQDVSFNIASASESILRQITLSKQRASSLRIKISDSNYIPGTEGSLSISGIALEIGMRNTMMKLDSTNRS
jgi:hypothetical protein